MKDKQNQVLELTNKIKDYCNLKDTTEAEIDAALEQLDRIGMNHHLNKGY